MGGGPGEGGGTVVGPVHEIAGAAEVSGDDLRHRGVVVDDQDAGGRGIGRRGRFWGDGGGGGGSTSGAVGDAARAGRVRLLHGPSLAPGRRGCRSRGPCPAATSAFRKEQRSGMSASRS
ncbi:hypothetical protein GCM10018980_49910 [Streptomyces capoamus]|uniref:Uncharacterized protein n=1 Tax=Streptomyces capoamus TaxID=68183 RepID=A0A919EZ63_9ACTN|nr:hypothetical protein GCM10018980_49910 [Streptomyces capoamus]